MSWKEREEHCTRTDREDWRRCVAGVFLTRDQPQTKDQGREIMYVSKSNMD